MMPFSFQQPISPQELALAGYSVYGAKLREKKFAPELFPFIDNIEQAIENETELLNTLHTIFEPVVKAYGFGEIYELPDQDLNEWMSKKMTVGNYDKHMSAREFLIYKQIEDFITKNPEGQICFLGGGLSMLPYYLAKKFPNNLFIDSDIETVSNAKQDWIKNSGHYAELENYQELTINLEKEVTEKLSTIPSYKKNKPVFCVLEGVTTYLKQPVIDNVFSNLSVLPEGSQIFVGFSTATTTGASKEELEILKSQSQSYETDISPEEIFQRSKNQYGLEMIYQSRHKDVYQARNNQKLPKKQIRFENYFQFNVSNDFDPNSELTLNDVPLLPGISTLSQICGPKLCASSRFRPSTKDTESVSEEETRAAVFQ